MATRNPIPTELKTLALRWKERRDALGYKGKRADSAMLDYFIGAATMADIAGNADLRDYLHRVSFFVVAIRGNVALVEWLDAPDSGPFSPVKMEG